MSKYLKTAIHDRPDRIGPALVIDVQGFDYDRSQHSNGTTLVVKDVTAADVRALGTQLLDHANQMEAGQ